MSDTGFDETPDVTSQPLLHEFAAEGLVNIGGCCGTTPDRSRRLRMPSRCWRRRCKPGVFFDA
jgi:methionine synthase I (cobalamin-dependent)